MGIIAVNSHGILSLHLVVSYHQTFGIMSIITSYHKMDLLLTFINMNNTMAWVGDLTLVEPMSWTSSKNIAYCISCLETERLAKSGNWGSWYRFITKPLGLWGRSQKSQYKATGLEETGIASGLGGSEERSSSYLCERWGLSFEIGFLLVSQQWGASSP